MEDKACFRVSFSAYRRGLDLRQQARQMSDEAGVGYYTGQPQR